MNAISFEATRRTVKSVVTGREQLTVKNGAEGTVHTQEERKGTRKMRKKEARKGGKKKRAKRALGRSIAFALSRHRADVIIYDVVNSDARDARVYARTRIIPLSPLIFIPRARWRPHKYGLRKCVSVQSHLSSEEK